VDTAAVSLTCDGVRVTSGTARPFQTLTNGGTLAVTTPIVRGREFYGTATYDPPSIAAGAYTSTTVSVQGAAVGDLIESISFNVGLAGIVVTGQVTGADTVTVWFYNTTASAVDLTSGTLRVMVRRRPY
jgi:hypothetical protein